jgi:hypothetical protein
MGVSFQQSANRIFEFPVPESSSCLVDLLNEGESIVVLGAKAASIEVKPHWVRILKVS